jgi:UDP-glucoronosyl/UDP-glucosyl transferase
LADRGHVIEFATLHERAGLVAPYPFVSRVHFVGRAVTAEEDESLYLRFSRWDNKTQRGRNEMIECKKFYDSWWPEVYRGLQDVVTLSRPDFIFSDYQVEAARDIAQEHCIPLATMWPQMPWLMVPHKWIPGEPGTQVRCLTSEHASLWDRLYDQTYLVRYVPQLLHLYRWTRQMRRENGVQRMPSLKPKPDYLLLVNSFWGLEPAKDVPPLIQPVGPILSNSYPPLDEQCSPFLDRKGKVVYVAFGTHVIASPDKLERLIRGLAMALEEGSIDGVVWAMRMTARKQLDPTQTYPVSSAKGSLCYTTEDLLSNRHPEWLFLDYAPQRAILDHSSTKVFLTHAGPSSANEAVYHGTPMISMPFYGDQIQHNLRLVAAGVAKSLDKDHFTARQVAVLVRDVVGDPDGEISRNAKRMQRIAHVASRRKHVAADLIEEHLYDWDLRFEINPGEVSHEAVGRSPDENGGRGQQLGPMHLQTADVRMSWIRASNMDEYLLFGLACLATWGLVCVIVHPILLGKEFLS